MNKKNFVLLFLVAILLISSVNFTSAFFYKNHIKWTLTGFDDVDSPITQLCSPYLKEFIDGDLAQDVPVLHYFDNNKVSSYIGTHSAGQGGLQGCLQQADTDAERCFCYGGGLHWSVQDRFSHTSYGGIDGLVVKYLKKYYSFNFIGHMTIERDYEIKSVDMYTKNNDPVITSGELEYYDSTALDSLFTTNANGEQVGSRYLELLNLQAGFDITRDASIFRDGYQGSGFYSTVYQDKISLPFWARMGCLITGIIGSLLIFVAIKFSKNKWKWFLIVSGIILIALALIVLLAIYTGNAWKVTTAFIEIPPTFGYLSVSQADIQFYDQQVQQATDEYLRTGEVVITDGSGLSYVDKNGQFHEGDLNLAQRTGIYFILPALLLILLSSYFVVIKQSFNKKSKKLNIFGKIGVGIVSFFLLFASILTIYMIFQLF